MFVVNQLLGTVMVHPDWDEQFREVLGLVKMLTVPYVVAYCGEISDIAGHFEGFSA